VSFAEWHYPQCCITYCHLLCYYGQCHLLYVIMFSVIMVTIVILSVFRLSVVVMILTAPKEKHLKLSNKIAHFIAKAMPHSKP